jgi:hypothetical protein
VRLEGLGILKKGTSSGLDPAAFRLVAWCLNQLRVPSPFHYITFVIFGEEKKLGKSLLCNILLPVTSTEVNSETPSIYIPPVW